MTCDSNASGSSRNIRDAWVFVDCQLSVAFTDEKFYGREVFPVQLAALLELLPRELDEVHSRVLLQCEPWDRIMKVKDDIRQVFCWQLLSIFDIATRHLVGRQIIGPLRSHRTLSNGKPSEPR